MRPSGRPTDALRPVYLEVGIAKHAEGSCLARFGDTQVYCTASVEEKVPGFLRGSGKGWITAEYGMLPRATRHRTDREAAKGKQSGRTQEIQRLIGRALRSATRLDQMGEMSIRIDCDVIQADGGTRTAAITGAYVALYQAFEHMMEIGSLPVVPLTTEVAAVSCGILEFEPVLDLDHAEDAAAKVDANFVMTGDGRLIEIQGTGEEEPFERSQFTAMLGLAAQGIAELVRLQRRALALE